MTGPALDALRHVVDYSGRLQAVLQQADWAGVVRLTESLRDCWAAKRQVFLFGNGGSAVNAIHLANDYVYGVSKRHGSGLRAIALPANAAVLTCLANDTGYDEIFAKQLAVQAQPGDVLIVLSGSGNSPNILRALEEARALKMESFAILGFSGGKARALADCSIHFPVQDMQIAEDLQLVVGHMAMQWMYANQPEGV